MKIKIKIKQYVQNCFISCPLFSQVSSNRHHDCIQRTRLQTHCGSTTSLFVKSQYQNDEFVAKTTIYAGPLITIVARICNRTEEAVWSPSSNTEIYVESSCSRQRQVCASQLLTKTTLRNHTIMWVCSMFSQYEGQTFQQHCL